MNSLRNLFFFLSSRLFSSFSFSEYYLRICIFVRICITLYIYNHIHLENSYRDCITFVCCMCHYSMRTHTHTTGLMTSSTQWNECIDLMIIIFFRKKQKQSQVEKNERWKEEKKEREREKINPLPFSMHFEKVSEIFMSSLFYLQEFWLETNLIRCWKVWEPNATNGVNHMTTWLITTEAYRKMFHSSFWILFFFSFCVFQEHLKCLKDFLFQKTNKSRFFVCARHLFFLRFHLYVCLFVFNYTHVRNWFHNFLA